MCIYYSAAVAVTCKKDVGMGLCMFNFVFYVITPAFAYCHANIHLVWILFGIVIPTYFCIFLKCFFWLVKYIIDRFLINAPEQVCLQMSEDYLQVLLCKTVTLDVLVGHHTCARAYWWVWFGSGASLYGSHTGRQRKNVTAIVIN